MKNWLQKAKYFAGLLLLCFFGIQNAINAQHFIFEYTGPDVLFVDNDCIAVLEWDNSTPTVDPAHPGNGQMITFFGLDNISGGYTQGDTIPPGVQVSVTYLAQDNMSNDSLFTFTIDFVDTIPPMLSGIAADITVECDAIPSPDPATAVDNCDPNPMIAFDADTISGPCDQSFGIIWTWTATDVYGNASSDNRVIIVFDDTDPTFVMPSDITVDCENAGDLNITGSPMAVMDNCDPSPIIYYSDLTTIGYCPHTYTITRTWSAEDDCLNAASGVQVITVQDTTKPTFVTEAIDENYICDTDTNAENAFALWLTNFGNANALDNCTATPALRWFAALLGSYDINDTLTYPGIFPISLDTAICPAPMMGVYRSKTVDFVVYDLCGNASVSTATFNVVDSIAPIFEYCPADITISNEAGQCEATYELPAPVITDECENNVVSEEFNTTSTITSVNPGDANTAIDPVVLIFTGIPTAPSSASGPVELNIDLINTDTEASEEYFTILGEDGSVLGQTNNSISQCDNSSTMAMISSSSFNNWTTDGELTITLSPNIPSGQPNFAINDICGGSSVNASVEYDSHTPKSIDFQYSVNGSPAVSVEPITAITEILPVGVNTINYYATDCAGNMATCLFTVTIEDVDAPQITCPSDITATLDVGDNCSLGVEITLPLPASIEDNCSFQRDTFNQPLNPAEALLTFSYEPNYLDYIADDKTVVFPGTFPNAAGSLATLKISITGDADETEEYFTIFSEDNMNLGTTEVGQPNVSVVTDTCPNHAVNVTTISIPVALFNNWASDGTISFNAISNKDFAAPAPGGPSDGINPSCTTFPPGTLDGTNDGESNLIMELIFQTVSPSYYAEGATIIPTTEIMAPNIPPSENFNVGITTVHYVVEDLAGNADTCSFDVTVEDTIPPTASCQPVTIFVNPSGVDDYTLDPSEVDGGSSDNCSIASMLVSPDTFICDQQGMAVPVTLAITDIYGNMSNCVTMVNVEAEQPEPTYAIGLCGNDTLSLFANPPVASGGAVFTFFWSGPNSFVSVEENPQIPNADDTYSGSYSVTITGTTGCTSLGTVEVSINASPDVPIISVNDNDLCLSDDLILSAQTYSGTVITYYWYEGIPSTGTLISSTSIPTLTIASPLTVGTTNYYVIVEVDGCFSQTSNFETINVTEIPNATVNDAVITVCEGEMIILGTSETGPNYTYEWTGPNGFSSSAQNPQTIMATLADEGTYTLVIYDNNCPSDPATTEVNVIPMPLTPMITSTGIACEGGEITLSTNIVNGDFYTWTAPDFSSQITSTNSLVISGVTPDDAGDWRVVVTINGCDSEMSDPLEVIVEPTLTVIPSNDGPVCSSEEIQLSVNSVSGATYSWSGPSGFISFVQNPIAPAVAGSYVVTITSSLGCTNSASTDVLVDALPTITAISNNGTPCVTGADDIQLFATIFPVDDGSFIYQWTGTNGFNSTDAIPTLPNGTSADNGSYTLVVTDGNGCSSIAETTVVNVTDVPETPSIDAPSQLCETENLTLTTQGYSGTSIVFTWTTPTGTIETSTPSLSIISASTLNSGIYQVEVTVDGCDSNSSGEVIIEVNSIPNTPVATSNAPVCESGTIELFTAFIPGASYIWTGPTGFLANVHNPAIFDASVDNEGAYSVQVIIDGCSSAFSAPINVMISPTPDPPSISNNSPICIDNPGASLILSVSPIDAIPGASYTWYNAQSGMQVGGPTTALNTTIIDFSNYSEGIYDFYVVAELNGCPAVSSIPTIVTMNEIPNNQAFAGDDILVCNETNIALNADPPTIGTGMWAQISGPLTMIANPNSPTSTISNLFAGNVYTFQWSLSNGACMDYDADEMIVSVDADTEEAEAGLNFDVCNDTTGQLNATPSISGATGLWTQTPGQSAMGVVIVNPDDPNTMVTGLEFDNQYIFTWSLSNVGCGEFSADEVVVSVEENNEIAFAGTDFVSCGDGQAQLNAVTPGSGTGTWSSDDSEVIFIDANDPQTIVQGLQTGFYSFIWTLDNGACGISSDEIELEYELAPEAINDEFTVNYSSSANFNVLNNDLVEGPVTVSVLSNPSNGSVENLGNGAFEYTANSSFTGIDEFSYQVCSQVCEDVCSEAVVSLRIGDDVECVAPTIFTPNNDGVNDAFIVPCFSTGNYPENTVSIYNQWGDEVFHASPYFNDWEGTYDGQDLPVGTYFFVVKYNTDQPPVSGFLVLER